MYINTYVMYFQTCSYLKPLDLSKICCVESSCEEVTKDYINGTGHMTKMAAMPIYMYGQNLLKYLLKNQRFD